MTENYFFEKRLEGLNDPEKGEYEACTFVNCNFSSGDLFSIIFVDCMFDNCDVSNANISNAAFRDVKFKNCKMLGLNFESSNEFMFSVDFENCQMDHSIFFKRQLKKTIFKNCSLKSVDFGEADLTEALFDECDLTRAMFENALLLKTDFRSSFNYSIDPEQNRIKKAKFSKEGIVGLLDKYDIDIE